MKIKLALLDSDQNYLNRIVTAFNIKYADKLEIYSFTKLESAMAALEPSRIDVLVASDTFVVESSALPKRCQLAYFVESADVDSVNDQRAICKFQKADLIYRQILSIYSEYAGSASGLKLGDDSCKVIAFTSPCGGVGSSTMAAACALHYAARGKRTLYLNFERFGSSDAFFAAEGQFDMSGIIFALKSKKTNLSMKMESCVKQDPRGVYFYSQSKVALDMLELGADEIGRLISEARLSGNYEYVIADLEFGMDRASLQILRQAGAIVWTGDGSEISNRKLARAYQALVILEQNAEVPLTARIALIYNKFSNKSGTAVTGTELRSIGGAPRYEHASTAQVLEQLAPKELFDKIQYTCDRAMYKEMQLTSEEMNNGVSELDALHNFAQRCSVKEIRKFTSILSQNIQKGGSELTMSLRYMNEESWEEKKQRAKRKGETAGTKLMIPLMIMFVGILFMIIVPIFSNML